MANAHAGIEKGAHAAHVVRGDRGSHQRAARCLSKCHAMRNGLAVDPVPASFWQRGGAVQQAEFGGVHSEQVREVVDGVGAQAEHAVADQEAIWGETTERLPRFAGM
jgi:hypothetical protein